VSFSGQLTHPLTLPVYRGILSRLVGEPRETWEAGCALRGSARRKPPGVAQAHVRETVKPGRDAGGSACHPAIGWIGAYVLPHAERRLTSRGCDRMRKTKQTVDRGSVYKG
jgi:hypothetical protein